MISINATLFLQVLHFLILIWILNRLLFRPILRLINDRNQHLEKVKRDVENIEHETTVLLNKCISMEKDARMDAGEERAKLKQEAMAQSDRIFEKTREVTEQIRGETEKEIDRQVEKTKDFLHREAAIIADEIIEKIIGRRVEA